FQSGPRFENADLALGSGVVAGWLERIDRHRQGLRRWCDLHYTIDWLEGSVRIAPACLSWLGQPTRSTPALGLLVTGAGGFFFLTCHPAGIYSHLNAPQVTPGLAGSPPPGPRGRFWSSRAGVFLHALPARHHVLAPGSV